MILSRSTRNRISAFANFLDRVVIRLRRFVRDTTPKRTHRSEAQRLTTGESQ